MPYAYHVSDEHREVIISLCSLLGIPLSDRNPQDGNSWDGTSIAVNNWDDLTTSNIIHEVAHWLVATKKERSLVDFGLGIGPDSGLFCDCTVEDPEGKECLASCLGILYEKALGFDWKDTFHYHQWGDDPKAFLSCYKDLREMGLVKWGGIPTVMP